MKRSFVFIAILALSDSTFAQENLRPYVISTRIGEEIDAEEHAYFKLFSSYGNFKRAQAFQEANGRVSFRVWLQLHDTTTTINTTLIDPIAIKQLRDYIENFETLTIVHEAELSFALRDTHVLRRPTPEFVKGRQKRRIQRTSLTTLDRELRNGHLLFAADSILVWKESLEPFNWRMAERATHVVQPTEIQTLTFENKGQFFKGLGIGLLIGGGGGAVLGLASGDDEGGIIAFSAGAKALVLGIVLGVPAALIGGGAGAAKGKDEQFTFAGNPQAYAEILPKLQANSYMMEDMCAPEVRKLWSPRQDFSSALAPIKPQAHAQADTSKKPGQTSQTIKSKAAPLPATQVSPQTGIHTPKFHLALSAKVTESGANGDMERAFRASQFDGTFSSFFGTITYPSDQSNHFAWGLNAEYDITRRIRLAAGWQIRPQQQMIGKNDERERLRGTLYNLGIEFVPQPVLPLLLSNFEGALGVGLNYESMELITDLRDGPHSVSALSEDKSAFGGYLKGTIDYYFVTSLSLRLGFQYFFLPKIDVSDRILTSMELARDERGNLVTVPVTRTLRAHSLSLSGLDVSFGMRFHF